MKQLLLLFSMFISMTVSITVVGGEYPVSAIPNELLKNANAVIRKQEQVIEINSLNKVTLRDHYVITILNEAGENEAYWMEYYSRLRTIHHIEGALYDAMGNKIRTIRKSEIKDEPVSSSMTMVDDDRIKYHNFYYKTFPYTVEYESEVTKSESMFLPSWTPLNAKNVAVELSSLTLISPIDYEVRVKIFNSLKPAVVTTAGKIKTSIWSISQQPPVPREYAAPGIYELAPYISFGPSAFKLGDYTGSMRTWKEYGQFIIKMNSGLTDLPQSIKDKVAQLTASAKSDEEKVKRLYEFMQRNTHYVGIQLGIGGWRPFSASYVAENGYGDCKALSNYMVALLKAAGIQANYVLIRSGENERDISFDFPSSQFNHAICAVPLKQDTIWLECTSQTVPAGYMGSFTGNRHALMITDDGGTIVATPRYDKNQNTLRGNFSGIIDPEGKLNLQAIITYQAECSDVLHGRIHAQSKEEQLKYLKKSLDIPYYDIVDFSYLESGGKIPSITENFHLQAPNYSQVSGKRLFIIPNVLNRWDNKLDADTARFHPVVLTDERYESDSVFIALPSGYRPESLPKPLEIQTPYGNYTASVTIKDDQLMYSRTLSLNRGRFPAPDYNKLVKFYEQVYKADRAKVVLVKSE
ncbi:DUF3857 domain-containing transglutaminase family protein [Flavihumibacter fluvii]|uniref:DUF3857 domain-containing transglutaminase family protein n=1 Tax=Flavihumibacter fluvii TaxID=2838157 RepID=UPI001BDF6DD2|nr:DUF3857 domain-containing protein [Flavihumibacter fluvii]ULQ53714.1 DUF3857 domain-containing protein [Flavihumibacter fluvii]